MTTNKWVEFVRKWAKKHNQTYMCAASKTNCQEEYHAMKSKSNSVGTKKRNASMSRQTRKNKKKMQSELLKKYKAYAEYKKKNEAANK